MTTTGSIRLNGHRMYDEIVTRFVEDDWGMPTIKAFEMKQSYCVPDCEACYEGYDLPDW